MYVYLSLSNVPTHTLTLRLINEEAHFLRQIHVFLLWK